MRWIRSRQGVGMMGQNRLLATVQINMECVKFKPLVSRRKTAMRVIVSRMAPLAKFDEHATKSTTHDSKTKGRDKLGILMQLVVIRRPTPGSLPRLTENTRNGYAIENK